MAVMEKLEDQLAKFYKGLPQLPDPSKESLAKAWPWLALIFGILQLFTAWGLWVVVRDANRIINFANSYYQAVTGTTLAPTVSTLDKTMLYVGIVVLVVDAVILLLAYPALTKREKHGWDLIFLGGVLNVAYAVLSLFLHDRGIGSFIVSLFTSFVAFYLLFQVREKYKA